LKSCDLLLDVVQVGDIRVVTAQLQGAFEAEQLMQMAGAANLLVDLVTGRTRAKGAAAPK
jgi:hypothetical protein